MTPEERVLEAYYDRLTVYPVEKSRVIVIDFLSEDPELAAHVANAIAEAYLERCSRRKQDQAQSAGAMAGRPDRDDAQEGRRGRSQGRGVTAPSPIF